jgi:hypothetical protein
MAETTGYAGENNQGIARQARRDDKDAIRLSDVARSLAQVAIRFRHPGVGRDPEYLMVAVFLDYSLRSAFRPTFSRSTRFALLSGRCRNDRQ